MNSAKNPNDPLAKSIPIEEVWSYSVPLMVTAVLLLSGCVHLFLLGILGASWHGPLSLRKPALFGISGGLTVFSLAWLMTKLEPRRLDRLLINSLSVALLIEVGLITHQYWRGVASHFNHSTMFNAAIEFTMLLLILIATGVILYLTWRTIRLRAIDPAMVIAIRGGMGLLALSCLLGIATSVLGEASLAMGGTTELWGKAGILKFPHGVALHAIQWLPILAWICQRLRLSRSVRVVRSALIAQVMFLVYSIWQTGNGRDRLDFDAVGGSFLAITILFTLYPTFEVGRWLFSSAKQKPA
ncbi:MAG: hypothetical protein NTW52_14340 [Planctomycetota bacterium]|nr:hypothetical protein [Planctomycetota bacterium]